MANVPPKHDPTPAEIREACERIRELWPTKRLRENERFEPPRLTTAREADFDLPPGWSV